MLAHSEEINLNENIVVVNCAKQNRIRLEEDIIIHQPAAKKNLHFLSFTRSPRRDVKFVLVQIVTK